jgi:acyl-CoA thioester hydrolase
MFEFSTQFRVRYGETDQMGYVYYGNYAEFYEVARVEMLRSIGMSYKAMEEQGIMLPVAELHCKYLKPALYDQLLTIKVTIPEMPGVKIRFTYAIYNENEELINTGETTLVFVRMKSGRPCLPTKEFTAKLKPFFE